MSLPIKGSQPLRQFTISGNKAQTGRSYTGSHCATNCQANKWAFLKGAF
jgi:hypothetical protein